MSKYGFSNVNKIGVYINKKVNELWLRILTFPVVIVERPSMTNARVDREQDEDFRSSLWTWSYTTIFWLK